MSTPGPSRWSTLRLRSLRFRVFMWVALGLAVGLPIVLYLEYMMTDRLARDWMQQQSALVGELLREKITEPADDLVQLSRDQGKTGRWLPTQLDLEAGTALLWQQSDGKQLPVPLPRLLEQLREVPLTDDSYPFLIDQSGTLIASLHDGRNVQVTLSTPQVQKTFQAETARGVLRLEDPVYHNPANLVMLNLPRLGLAVGVIFPDQEIADQLAPLVVNLLAEAAVLLTLAWLFSYLLAHRLTAPLEQLAVAVKRMARGEGEVPIPTSNVREISTLSTAFTQMRAELKSYLEQLERTTAETARVGRELELARAIQGNHDVRHRQGGWQVEGRSEAAREVGGDFFEVFDLAEGRTALLLGDVSGKGIPAALYTLLGRAGLKLALSQGASPAEALVQANRLLGIDNPDSVFTTALVAILDTARGELVWARAGHPTPLTPSGPLVGPNGPPLGLLEEAVYREVTTPLQAGPYLLYTDGFSEAEDEGGGFLTVEPLRAALEEGGDLWALLHAHRAAAEPSDDATALLLRPL